MLRPKRLGGRVRLGVLLGTEDELEQTLAVAQVDEDQAAVVTTTMDPAGDANLVADVFLAGCAAPGGAVAVGEGVGHSIVERSKLPIWSSKLTTCSASDADCCLPVSMSLTSS